MSVSVPKGLASSGQKPITEITHPLSAAEEPLSISLITGDKVQSSEGVEIQPTHGDRAEKQGRDI